MGGSKMLSGGNYNSNFDRNGYLDTVGVPSSILGEPTIKIITNCIIPRKSRGFTKSLANPSNPTTTHVNPCFPKFWCENGVKIQV